MARCLVAISNTVPSPFAPPLRCRAEQVAVGVGDQAALRVSAVGAVEADQRGGRAGVAGGGLDDLEHRAAVVRPAVRCRAEQVAVGVGDQAAVRVWPLEPLKLTSVVGVLA